MFLRKLCDIEAKVVEPLCSKCDENSKDLNEKAKAKVLSSIRQIIEVIANIRRLSFFCSINIYIISVKSLRIV